MPYVRPFGENLLQISDSPKVENVLQLSLAMSLVAPTGVITLLPHFILRICFNPLLLLVRRMAVFSHRPDALVFEVARIRPLRRQHL